MTVFIVQEPLRRNTETGAIEPRVNLRSAEPFGKFVYLASWRALEIPGAFPAVVEDLEDKLANFSDKDYLLPVGSPILIGVAAAIAAGNNAGRMKLLAWDRLDRAYNVIEVRLEDFDPAQKGFNDDDQSDNQAGRKAKVS